MTLMIASFFLTIGLLGLVMGADWLVDGALGIAKFFNLPAMWVGTVLVGIATTIPEMLVSLAAVLQHHTDIALGNALGSYVANIGLVLGLTACCQPLKVHRKLFQRELPALTLACGLLFVLLLDHHLSQMDGMILLLALLLFLVWVTRFVLQQSMPKHVVSDVVSDQNLVNKSVWVCMAMFLLGLTITWLAAKSMVVGAKSYAQYFGLSDLLVGLTVVAVGTSLPELATSIVSVRKGHHDLALGNVLGSNIFGVLGVVAIPALMAPGAIAKSVLTRDMVAMGVMTVLLWCMAYSRARQRALITRTEGVLLFVVFLGYLVITLH